MDQTQLCDQDNLIRAVFRLNFHETMEYALLWLVKLLNATFKANQIHISGIIKGEGALFRNWYIYIYISIYGI